MINYLERRFGRFAIPNVTLILIIGQVLLFAATMHNQELWLKLQLIPRKVLDGEFIRLVTFLFLPPGMQPIFAFFYWYLFYLMGTALEHYWGTFRYNIFLLIGYIAIVALGFVTPDGVVSNHFVEGTVFLAFAYLNPNFELRMFFILPVRIKWFAMMTWIVYGSIFIWGTWPARLQVVASILNLLVFFGPDIYRRMVSGQRRMYSQAKRFAEKEPEYFHVCSICEITDRSHPTVDFRYCSQCSGNRAYCEDHLKDHDHVFEEGGGS